MMDGTGSPLTLQQLAELLEGVTTVIACHPSQEAAVRDLLVRFPPPAPVKVQPDPSCPADKVFLMRPPSPGEWFA